MPCSGPEMASPFIVQIEWVFKSSNNNIPIDSFLYPTVLIKSNTSTDSFTRGLNVIANDAAVMHRASKVSKVIRHKGAAIGTYCSRIPIELALLFQNLSC